MRKRLLCMALAVLMAAALSACGEKDVGIIGGADGPTTIVVSE
ncbi:MAG: hypothetical protein ACI4PV_09170 [Butyricicoccus sp.]